MSDYVKWSFDIDREDRFFLIPSIYVHNGSIGKLKSVTVGISAFGTNIKIRRVWVKNLKFKKAGR